MNSPLKNRTFVVQVRSTSGSLLMTEVDATEPEAALDGAVKEFIRGGLGNLLPKNVSAWSRVFPK